MLARASWNGGQMLVVQIEEANMQYDGEDQWASD